MEGKNMIPFAFIILALGWIDLPPAPAELPAIEVRTMTRAELLERRRDGREARRRRRQARERAEEISYE